MKYIVALLVLCAGCAAERPLQNASTPAQVQMVSPAALTPPAPKQSSARGMSVAPTPSPNISLEWDNPNADSASWPLKYCLTEFAYTTDVTKPFKFKAYAQPLTNRITFVKTNSQEFYICRFVWTNVTPWEVTAWNTK